MELQQKYRMIHLSKLNVHVIFFPLTFPTKPVEIKFSLQESSKSQTKQPLNSSVTIPVNQTILIIEFT